MRYAPTAASVAVFGDRLKDAAAARAAFTTLMQEVEALNKAHSGRLPAIRTQL
ncbi:MAG: hypothetical protein M3541_19925 [Acidobacteriota bacterium]|nr:hypothetical protein [Acidobacteriota bacterium]MDQ3421010.1 hypothetical protein [Acidobacteriota bacterium]